MEAKIQPVDLLQRAVFEEEQLAKARRDFFATAEGLELTALHEQGVLDDVTYYQRFQTLFQEYLAARHK